MLNRNSTKDSVPAKSALFTPSDLPEKARGVVAATLNPLIADAFALYLKTKNFHWHMSGPNFRDYHLMLDEHSTQIFATIDPLAERVRKLGQPTLRSIGHVAKLTRIADDDRDFVTPYDMLVELLTDNRNMAAAMREAHDKCDEAKDVASASLLEVYIDETERRVWFLFESANAASQGGH